MKKIFGICICLILLVSAVVAPNVAWAAESSTSAAVIHFLNPTAVAIAGDNLFVADNVDLDNNNSVILSFTLSDTEAVYCDTIEIDGNVTNLSAKGDNGLYAVLSDKVIEYTVGSNAKLTKVQEFNIDGELNGFVDAVYGQSGANQTEYFLTQQGLYRNDAGGWAEKFSNPVSSVAIDNFVYYLQTDDASKAVSKRYNGTTHAFTQGDVYNNSNGLASKYAAQPLGMFAWGNDLGVFWNDKIHYVEVGAQTCNLPRLLDYAAVKIGSEETINIKDVEASNGRLFVLNDKNLVEVYEGEADNMSFVYSVGSDVVDQPVPHTYTTFTLAHSKGYPSNLVFKTNEESTSIAELVTDAEEYIILGYTGDEDSLYYYVLTNDNHFGWVKKSNTEIAKDEKIEIVDTAVSHNGSVEYKTAIKFASLNAVYIYKLPRSVEAFRDTTFTQTATTMPEVTVLQRFTETVEEDEIVWYYVSFQVDNHVRTGFVQEKDLGQFSLSFSGNVPADSDRKINSTLFEAVKVYRFPSKNLMTDDNVVTTEDGAVKLYSGRRVTLLGEEGDFSLIQIVNGDGSVIYGYVLSNRLIGLHAMTTNAIVGLTLLAIAIALATALIVVFMKRKKGTLAPRRKKENKSEE